MIRFLARLSGFLLLAGAFASVIVDGTRTIAGSELSYTRAGDFWFALSPGTLNMVQAGLERYVSIWLWDPFLVTILFVPLALLLGGVGFLLLLLGRRPEARIGWSSRD